MSVEQIQELLKETNELQNQLVTLLAIKRDVPAPAVAAVEA
jgi:hypothetical protein